MAYNKTTWETGDTITAEKLNNAENGIEAHDPFIIDVTNDLATATMNKKVSEIIDAIKAGKNIIVRTLWGSGDTFQAGFLETIGAVADTGGGYIVGTVAVDIQATPAVVYPVLYNAATDDDYPVATLTPIG